MTTSSNERSQLLERLQTKEFRDALVEADIANRILFQLQTLLEERGWTQNELAERAGTAQPVVSKYMRGYENFSVKTLKKLASAFDVSLTVSFERFSELLNRYLKLDSADWRIPSFNEDAALYAPAFEYSPPSSVTISGTFITESFVPPLPAEQLALNIPYGASGTPEPWSSGAKTHQHKEERRYALAFAA